MCTFIIVTGCEYSLLLLRMFSFSTKWIRSNDTNPLSHQSTTMMFRNLRQKIFRTGENSSRTSHQATEQDGSIDGGIGSSKAEELQRLVSKFRQRLRDHPILRSDSNCTCEECSTQAVADSAEPVPASDQSLASDSNPSTPTSGDLTPPSTTSSTSTSTYGSITQDPRISPPTNINRPSDTERVPIACSDREQANYLIKLSADILDLNEHFDGLLHDRYHLTKDPEVFEFSLVYLHYIDLGGQNIRGFLRNSFALGENEYALDDTCFSTPHNRLAVASKRISLVIDRITLEVGRYVAMRDRIVLRGNEHTVSQNKIDINTAMINILLRVQQAILEQPWTRTHLKRLLCYFEDNAEPPRKKLTIPKIIITAPDGVPSYSSPVDDEPPQLEKTAQPGCIKPKTHADEKALASSTLVDDASCPNCEEAFNLSWLEQNLELGGTDRICPMCQKKLGEDFVANAVVKLAVSGKIDF